MDDKFVTRISRNFSRSEITETGDSSPPSQYPPVFETEPKPLDTKPRKKGGFITDENEKPKTRTTEARVTRRFLKNEPTNLKFCTVGRVEVPETVIQRKFPKNFPPSENGVFRCHN